MPTLTIDNRKITVPDDTQVIEAAEQLGIMIPRFCYHPALGAVGACRMCAVKFLDGPVKGLQMSCMTRAMDGMVVSTTHPEAVDFRRHIIEWLMLNHPHDCPVCDEGGHCLLQDETVSGGHGRRRYTGAKRTFRDQDLGPLVQHEMNRCIHCYRCVRFYQEYAGYRDFGALGIGARLYFGRFADGALENPFSGNLIDLCPTGVLTDKPSRYKARYWDLERSPSLCLHCSLGCNTTVNGRYRELIRLTARPNPKVNGHFLCDRGRYGFGYTNQADRPRLTESDGRAVTREEGLTLAAERLRDIIDLGGSSSVAVLGSERNSLETQLLLARLCRELQWRGPNFFVDGQRGRALAQVIHRVDRGLAASPADLERADLLIVVGLDPLNEAPMLALALRQAVRHGARLLVLDPRPIRLSCDFEHLPATLAEIPLLLARLVKKGLTGVKDRETTPEIEAFLRGLPESEFEPNLMARLDRFGQLLAESSRPALLCGTRLGPETLPALVLDLARAVAGCKSNCRFFLDPGGPNSVGATLLSAKEDGFEETLAAIETGEVQGLVVVEADPFHDYPDRERLEQALQRLKLLLVLDYLPSPVYRQAHLRLPTATFFEAGGSFISQAGILQYGAPAYPPGLPLHRFSQESHPPRHFSHDIPLGTTLGAYPTLLALGGKLGVELQTAGTSPWSLLPEDFPGAVELRGRGYPADGVKILAESATPSRFTSVPLPPADQGKSDGLTVLVVEAIFGTEELSSRGEVVQGLTPAPWAWMHPDDAAPAGLSDRCRVRLDLGRGEIELEIRLEAGMARGCFILPRHYRLRDRLASWPRRLQATELTVIDR